VTRPFPKIPSDRLFQDFEQQTDAARTTSARELANSSGARPRRSSLAAIPIAVFRQRTPASGMSASEAARRLAVARSKLTGPGRHG